MPNGILSEHLVYFADAATIDFLPSVKVRLRPALLRRWAKDGIFNRRTGERVKLERVCIGRRPATSTEALERFMRRLSTEY